MRNRAISRAVAVFLFSIAAASSFANTILEAALEDLKVKGSEAFLTTITRGSALEGDKTVLTQSVMLTSVGTYYGRIESWHILASCPITDRVKTTFFVVDYEKGPLFGYAVMYTTATGADVTTKFFFHTDVDKVFPNGVGSKRFCDG